MRWQGSRWWLSCCVKWMCSSSGGRMEFLDRWLQQRTPVVTEQTLRHRQIYILPSRAGWGYLALLLVILVMAINYQNNLIYALVFLLFGVMVSSMHATYGNLAGLCLRQPSASPCFCHELASIKLPIEDSRDREREQVGFFFTGMAPVLETMEAGESLTLRLSCRVTQRGWFRPKALGVCTVYPLGLFYAWTWQRLDFSILVYPAPEAGPMPSASVHDGSTNDQLGTQSGDQDFAGLGRYRPGSTPSRIAWKQMARGQGMYLKLFDEPDSETLWLDWEAMPTLDDEARLSRLCYWCLELDRQNVLYGVRLPGIEIEPDRGEVHRLAVLKTLALYGKSDSGGRHE